MKCSPLCKEVVLANAWNDKPVTPQEVDAFASGWIQSRRYSTNYKCAVSSRLQQSHDKKAIAESVNKPLSIPKAKFTSFKSMYRLPSLAELEQMAKAKEAQSS